MKSIRLILCAVLILLSCLNCVSIQRNLVKTTLKVQGGRIPKNNLPTKNYPSSKKHGDKSVHSSEDMMVLPPKLLPYFAAFMLDSVAVGIALPLLPFFVMELGANALQLSLVVSANYMTQMIGCIVMGKLSDLYGRRFALVSCLGASALSFFCVSKSSTLILVTLVRIISGSFGGLVPVIQSAVADSTLPADRPKYLGRVMATFGLGFVLGPALSTVLPNSMTSAEKIRLAACFPFAGLLIAVLFAQETKSDARQLLTIPTLLPKFDKIVRFNSQINERMKNDVHINVGKLADIDSPGSVNTEPKFIAIPKNAPPVRLEVIFLVLNGFLNMYAFGTETIYAVFLKDTFGHGETVLSALFAVNGLITGIFQVFLIKRLIDAIGVYATLALGNIFLAVGMIGLAMVRHQGMHFLLFGCHILGYTIADTALVSLITTFSAANSQGRDLSLNQAAQSAARIFSPLIAGILYEHSRQFLRRHTHKDIIILSKSPGLHLPVGALPFVVGGLCPLIAISIPVILRFRRSTVRSEKTIPKS